MDIMFKKSLLLLFLFPFQLIFAQTSLLTDFPDRCTPKEVGKRLAYHFVDGKHMLHIGKWISYPETFTWLGGLKYASLTNDQELLKLLEDRFELLFTSEIPCGWSIRFSASPMLDPQMNQIEFGINPDVKVDMTNEDMQKGKDTMIEIACKLLKD